MKNLSTWRRIALVAWERPTDPSVYGLAEFDMGPALAYLSELNQKASVKITPLHLLVKATAKMLDQFPELNVLVRHNRLYHREEIDIFVQIFSLETGRADLSGTTIRNAHQKTVVQIAQEIADRSVKIRQGKDPHLKEAKRKIVSLPPLFIKWSLKFLSFLGFDLNIYPKFLKMPANPFGAAMITNIGTFGLKMAWAPLVPFSRTPIVFTTGIVTHQPVCDQDQVVIKPILPVGVTVDHRIIDGYLAGQAHGFLKELFAHPKELLS